MPTALCTPGTASATNAPGLPALPATTPLPTSEPAPPRRSARPPREPLEQRLPRMARAFATLFLEVEAGLRPRRQLRNLMCPVLYARLEEVWIRDTEEPARLLNLLAGWDAPGCYDVVCTVSRGTRITALAFRLRRGVDGWRVDDLARPEDGPLPDPAYPVPINEPDIFELVGV